MMTILVTHWEDTRTQQERHAGARDMWAQRSKAGDKTRCNDAKHNGEIWYDADDDDEDED